PIEFIGGDLFRSVDIDEDGQVAHADLQKRLGDWFTEWDVEKIGDLTATQLTDGINGTLTKLREQNAGGTAQAGGRRGRGGAGGPGGFRGPGGPGGPGGAAGGRPGRGGVDLDPLVLENDASRPLASKLLAVPELRARYLSYVRDIAENWLDWDKSGPRILRYQALIEEDMKSDTRKLDTIEAFYAGIDSGQRAEEPSLRNFFEKRRAFLLEHEEVGKAKKISHQ
ncbi:MAG: CotH kinase family protein, partial [Verrucomicrobiia bacterium]